VNRAGKVFAAALLAALGWAVAPVAQAQPPIRIGASLSQTGAYAALGQNVARGYQLCVKHARTTTAIRIYERLITQEKVDLILSPYGSLMTAPVANVTERHRMPMVAPAIGTTSIFTQPPIRIGAR
jgi:branched-chain amino acid transport system substrate-binding protein